MVNEPLKFEYRIPRSAGYLLAGGSLYSAFMAIGTGLSEPYGVNRWEWVSQATGALLFTGASFVFARWSLRVLLANRRDPVYVELTDDALKVPRIYGFGWTTETLVPMDQVSKMRCSRIGSSEAFRLWYTKKGMGMPAEFLAGPGEFRALRTGLTERLEARGVPVEQREFRFSRPQFSLRFLFLVTTLTAVLYGLMAYVGTPLGIEGSVFLLLLISCEIAVFVVIVSGRWWMRAFLIGFVAGFICEFYAVYLVLESGTNGVALWEGGPLVYPITSLLWQEALPYLPGSRLEFLPILTGPALSGALFGLLAVGGWAVARRWIRKRQS